MAYQNLQFIAYVVNTSPVVDGKGVQSYPGLPVESQDIDARCQLLTRAIQTAAENLAASPPDSALKVFMIPEFYFRGANGAYTMDGVQAAIVELQSMVTNQWQDWVFVFGSIVGTMQSTAGQPATFNFSLVQQGGAASNTAPSAVSAAKLIMSGIEAVDMSSNATAMLLTTVLNAGNGSSDVTNSQRRLDYAGEGTFTQNGIAWALNVGLDGDTVRLPFPPGTASIQAQLIPSCGATVLPAQVIAEQQGYVFNCDGKQPVSSVQQVEASGSPPVQTLSPISVSGSFPVADGPVEIGTQSPPQEIAIDQLYQGGAGVVNLYEVVVLPPSATTPGSAIPLSWDTTSPSNTLEGFPSYRFDFSLGYDGSGNYITTTCRIVSPGVDFKGLNYLVPLNIQTTDAQGRTVYIAMNLQRGSSGYDYALWCDINVPGLVFRGIAIQFCNNTSGNAPLTCW
jgi:hypothetical protein